MMRHWCKLNHLPQSYGQATSNYFLTNCTSALIFTSSLTNTPPASSAAFQFKPKSVRLILPVNEKPAFSFPQGSLVTPPNSTVNVTSLVTPLIVSLPLNSYSSSPFFLN